MATLAPTTSSSPTELMRLHLGALYTHDTDGKMQCVNEWTAGKPPRFHLGRTVSGHVWRFSATLPEHVTTQLAAVAATEPVLDPLPEWPVYRGEYERLLAKHDAVVNQWSGPAYAFPLETETAHCVPGACELLNASSGESLARHLPEWVEDTTHRSPFVGVAAEKGGDIVAVCSSVRITPDAHEAGVETAAGFRRRGYALQAVVHWANQVRLLSPMCIPMYSTSWDNLASRGLASTLALSQYGVDYHVD